MHLHTYLDLLQTAETTLAGSYRHVVRGHAAEADVHYTCRRFASQCDAHIDRLPPVLTGYESRREAVPQHLHVQGLMSVRDGPLGLLRDLQDLYQLVSLVDITWTLVAQAGRGTRNRMLLDAVARCAPRDCDAAEMAAHADEGGRAPQALLVAS